MKTQTGKITSLHLHPSVPGQQFQAVSSIEVLAGKGIVGNPRYFSRTSRSGGPSKRQVSLIERERIDEHAAALQLETISPGTVRSNIETSGINLVALIGRQVRVGEAILFFYEPRTPCAKMDAIRIGLRALMADSRQGVMAQVIRSGRISIGDDIVACDPVTVIP